MSQAHSEPPAGHLTPRAPALHIELVGDGESLTADWDRLADETGAAPFLRPGWVRPWSEAFAPGRLRLLTARRDGRLVGAMAVVTARGALRSAANAHTPFTDLLAADEDVAEAMATWIMEPGRFRQVDLRRLPYDDRCWRSLAAAANTGARPTLAWVPVRSPYLTLDGDWETFIAGLPRDLRHGVRRTERRLNEHGEVRLEIHHGRDGLDLLLDDCFALEGSGWKTGTGTAILSDDRTERFYREVASWAAGRGMLRLLFLASGGRRLATNLCLYDGGTLYTVKGGFDPAFSRFGPGAMMIWLTLKHGFATGLRRYDFLGTDDHYKLRWTTDVRPVARMLSFGHSPCGHAERSIRRHGLPIARRLRRLPAMEWVSP